MRSVQTLSSKTGGHFPKLARLFLPLLLTLTGLTLIYILSVSSLSHSLQLGRATADNGTLHLFFEGDGDGTNMVPDAVKQLAMELQDTGPMGEVSFPQVPSFETFEEREKWCAERYGSEDVVVVDVPPSIPYGRFRMALYGDRDIVSANIIINRQWEPWTTDAMFRIFGNASLFLGKTFIDVGANVGWFTLVALSKGITVLAFEPDQKNRRLIEYSVCLNEGFGERLTLYSMGLAEQNQTCYILSSIQNSGDGVTVCNKAQQQELDSSSSQYSIRNVARLTSLDNLLAANLGFASQSFSIMKIDTEGQEAVLLSHKGADIFFSNRVTRPAMLFVELFNCMQDKCEEDRGLVEMMIGRGYSVWRNVDGLRRGAIPGWKNVSNSFDELVALGKVSNVIFVDRDHVTSDLKDRYQKLGGAV